MKKLILKVNDETADFIMSLLKCVLNINADVYDDLALELEVNKKYIEGEEDFNEDERWDEED